MAQQDIIFVSMPFSPPQRPSIALGILKALLTEAGLPSLTMYPNLWFAEGLGLDFHELLTGVGCQEGLIEWLFAPLAFPEAERDDAQFIERMIRRNPNFPIRNIVRLAAQLGMARKVAARTVEDAANHILALRPRVVGCTSMFQQHVASLALLRRLKAAAPEIVTLMGGPNCETRMGRATHQNYPWVDYVVSGEAEELIVPLVRGALLKGADLAVEELPLGVFGPVHRREGYPTVASGDGVPRASVQDFTKIPQPDYSDYFTALALTPSRDRIVASLPIETARGCWWGAQSHCTFCGLNGTSMAFRSKPPERVVEEICDLEARYGVQNMSAVDNIIDIRYFDTVFPELTRRGAPARLFYETKSNLKRKHLVAAREANVTALQPGIESLTSAALKHMGKGVQGWQNIQYLRLAAEQGIRTIWLNLVGFPDEDDDWHRQSADLFPLLTHLEPGGVTRVRYDRYSPLFNKAADRGVVLLPTEGYQHIYPVRGEALHEQSYFFEEAPLAGVDDDGGWTAPQPDWRPGATALFRASHAWQREWRTNRPVLAMIENGDGLVVEDSRACAAAPLHRLTGAEHEILLLGDGAPTEKQMLTDLSQNFSEAESARAIEALVAAKLLLPIDGRLLALPTLGHARSPKPNIQHPLGMILPREKVRDAHLSAAE